MDGYYVVEVEPTIAAQHQHTAAFAADDTLFHWKEFPVWPQPGRLIGCTALIRGTNGTRQEEPFDLYFDKKALYSLGTPNAACALPPSNDIVGALRVDATHYMDGLPTMEVASVQTSARLTLPTPDQRGLVVRQTSGIVWGAIPRVPSNFLYVGGVAQGALDFQSTCRLAASYTAGQTATITLLNSKALTNLAVGDVIHSTNSGVDAIIGTIKSVDTANQVTLEAANTAALTINHYVYPIHPIKLLLSFAYTGS